MKRIIFSLFNSNIDTDHVSTDEYKRKQFQRFYPHIKKRHEEYAAFCGAEYKIVETEHTNYNQIQHQKIILFEIFGKTYDEVVYLDFDVVPNLDIPNIFETLDFTKIGIHPIHRYYSKKEMAAALEYDSFDYMNIFIKICAKKTMLMLSDVAPGDDYVHNTGVLSGNSEVISKLQYTDRLPEMDLLLEESRTDSIYPVNVSSKFMSNNEVYMTYLLERFDIPHFDLPMSWNFILDPTKGWLEPTDKRKNSHMIHHVGKEFEISFLPHRHKDWKYGEGSA